MMKLKSVVLPSLLITLVFSGFARAATSSLCPGEEGYFFTNFKHRNPTRGGFVSNLSDVQDTDDMIMIAPETAICGSSRVEGRARIFGSAVIRNAIVSGAPEISGEAVIEDGAEVRDNARIQGRARISGSVRISGNALVTEDARVQNFNSDHFAEVSEDARVSGSAVITGNAFVGGKARVMNQGRLSGDVQVRGDAVIRGFTKRDSGSISSGTLNDPDFEAIERDKMKAAEEERLRLKRIADEALAKEKERQSQILKQKLAKESIEREMKETRQVIEDIASQVGIRISYSKNFCRLKFDLPAGKSYDVDFTADSTAYPRSREINDGTPRKGSPKAGVQVEAGKDGTWELIIQAEEVDRSWPYFSFFNVNDRGYADRITQKLVSYWGYCSDR